MRQHMYKCFYSFNNPVVDHDVLSEGHFPQLQQMEVYYRHGYGFSYKDEFVYPWFPAKLETTFLNTLGTALKTQELQQKNISACLPFKKFFRKSGKILRPFDLWTILIFIF